jgi:hypothetical protein
MDSSDIIKRNMQLAQSSGFLEKVRSLQAGCVTTTCISTLTTCVISYPDYATRNNVLYGMLANGTYSTLCR